MINRRSLVAVMASAPLSAAASRSEGSEPSGGSIDDNAIRATALDYILGWYAGDAPRMERAVHPELAKRILRPQPDGTQRFEHMGAMSLVQRTRAGLGKNEPNTRADVIILDRYEGAASVRINASSWVDYLHLARVGSEWKIINVLWELVPAGREQSTSHAQA